MEITNGTLAEIADAPLEATPAEIREMAAELVRRREAEEGSVVVEGYVEQDFFDDQHGRFSSPRFGAPLKFYPVNTGGDIAATATIRRMGVDP